MQPMTVFCLRRRNYYCFFVALVATTVSLLLCGSHNGKASAFVMSHVKKFPAPRSRSFSNSIRSQEEQEDASVGAAVDIETANNSHPDPLQWLMEAFQSLLKTLASLSLKDYKWRISIFAEKQADRMLEDSLARMRGSENSYYRPMDAQRLGPLGRLEKSAVEWLLSVFEEEERRAQQMATSGTLVRPMEAAAVAAAAAEDEEEYGSWDSIPALKIVDTEEQTVKGPLAFLERTVVDFIDSIRVSERERVRTNTLRPKDLDEANRGPLGQLERIVLEKWVELTESEQLRAQQSRTRSEVVRPIDVPGPLGELELAVAEVIQAEQLRSKEGQEKTFLVRPKDAKWPGPLGDAEFKACQTMQELEAEERERLRSIQRALQERRPMDSEQESFLGWLESFLVGIWRGPRMFMRVLERVQKLLNAAGGDYYLDEVDQQRIKTLEQDPTIDDDTFDG